MGVAISGGDFGCQIDGTCSVGSVQLPLTSLGGGDGAGQMSHFVQDDGVNLFRLPISWQFLVNNQVGATLDSGNLGKYNQLVQTCLGTGAYCMLDIHNFARFNGGIIGQGGPTDDDFVSLWTQLATKYASSPKIIFEVMNEPHDLDISTWAASVQKVVTAIRNAGATSQMILLPGTNFDSAATIVSSGSAAALLAIANPDGSTDGLLLDVHKYLDVDNSGTHATCVTNNTDAFGALADFLRNSSRQAFVGETGASSDPTCLADFCAQNAFINANSDVYVGYAAWGAGSLTTSYLLSLTPSKQGNNYVDNQLFSQSVLAPWANSEGENPPQSSTAAGSATATGTQVGTATGQSGTATATAGAGAGGTVMQSRGRPNPRLGIGILIASLGLWTFPTLL